MNDQTSENPPAMTSPETSATDAEVKSAHNIEVKFNYAAKFGGLDLVVPLQTARAHVSFLKARLSSALATIEAKDAALRSLIHAYEWHAKDRDNIEALDSVAYLDARAALTRIALNQKEGA
jgi:hypothetical protein